MVLAKDGIQSFLDIVFEFLSVVFMYDWGMVGNGILVAVIDGADFFCRIFNGNHLLPNREKTKKGWHEASPMFSQKSKIPGIR